MLSCLSRSCSVCVHGGARGGSRGRRQLPKSNANIRLQDEGAVLALRLISFTFSEASCLMKAHIRLICFSDSDLFILEGHRTNQRRTEAKTCAIQICSRGEGGGRACRGGRGEGGHCSGAAVPSEEDHWLH